MDGIVDRQIVEELLKNMTGNSLKAQSILEGTVDRPVVVLGSCGAGKSTLVNSIFAQRDRAQTSTPTGITNIFSERDRDQTSRPTGKALTGHIENTPCGVKVVCTNMEGSVVGEYDLRTDARTRDLRERIEKHLNWHVTLLDEDGKEVLDTVPLARHAVLTVRQMDREVCCRVGPRMTIDTKSPGGVCIYDTPGFGDVSIYDAPGFGDAHAAAFDLRDSRKLFCSPRFDSNHMISAPPEHKFLRRAERLETKRRSLAVKSGDPSGPWSKSVKQSLRMHKQNGPRRC
eukprot:TRINITY_DN791_c0_g1_i5.p1 TRINITY_DN791_c0_g1~~TRINITY_DN791_c0_g1_i5.p1  ORF type:complete len:286 (+),score=17.04 TRINITY_DN791_c0_g1_i5:96-953(+)